ncbi:MAG: hypothetical protein ACLFWL_18920 [Candidatus Brocadiia bacterium]
MKLNVKNTFLALAVLLSVLVGAIVGSGCGDDSGQDKPQEKKGGGPQHVEVKVAQGLNEGEAVLLEAPVSPSESDVRP